MISHLMEVGLALPACRQSNALRRLRWRPISFVHSPLNMASSRHIRRVLSAGALTIVLLASGESNPLPLRRALGAAELTEIKSIDHV